MPPPALLLLLLLSLPAPPAAESLPQLPAPQNVTIYSYNFHNLLRWAPVEVANSSVLYTVQYHTLGYLPWEEINCTNITKTECDFTHPDIKSSWTLFLRVRAQLGEVKSDWVETDRFVADENTTIGPPVDINVTSAPDSLMLTFQPPFKEDTSKFPLDYCVRYWEKSTNKQCKQECTMSVHIKLPNLTQLTVYCFQIQAQFLGERILNNNNIGQLSNTYCHRTTATVATRAGFVVLKFVGATIVVISAIICFFFIKKFHKAVKYWFQPPFKLPLHIEKYLKDPETPVLEEWQNNCAEEDHWDSLSIVSSAEGSEALVRNNLNTNVHSDNRSTESQKT